MFTCYNQTVMLLPATVWAYIIPEFSAAHVMNKHHRIPLVVFQVYLKALQFMAILWANVPSIPFIYNISLQLLLIVKLCLEGKEQPQLFISSESTSASWKKSFNSTRAFLPTSLLSRNPSGRWQEPLLPHAASEWSSAVITLNLQSCLLLKQTTSPSQSTKCKDFFSSSTGRCCQGLNLGHSVCKAGELPLSYTLSLTAYEAAFCWVRPLVQLV